MTSLKHLLPSLSLGMQNKANLFWKVGIKVSLTDMKEKKQMQFQANVDPFVLKYFMCYLKLDSCQIVARVVNVVTLPVKT